MRTLQTILTMLCVLALAAVPAMGQSGRYRYDFTVIDEFGDTMTDAVTFVIYDGSSGSDITSACYTTNAGTTAVDVSAVTGGALGFWSASAYVDVTVTHDTNSQSMRTYARYPYHHRLMLSRHVYVAAGATYTGTVTGVASNWTGTMTLGVDATGVDFQLYGDTTLNSALWDYSDDRLEFTAADILLDDNSDLIVGSGSDFTIESDTAATLEILPVVTDESASVNLGVDTAGCDLKVFGATTANHMLFDASDDRLEMVAADILFDDNSDLIFGSNLDFTIESDTAATLEILPVVTNELAYVHIGADTAGGDLKLFGATTGEYWLWDASADSILPNCGNALFTMTDAEADQFKVDATGTVADFAIVLKTTDGGVQIDADGSVNGDVTIDAADTLSLLSASTVAVTTTGAEADQFKVDAQGTIAGYAVVLQTTNGGVHITANDASNGDILIDAADDLGLTAAGDVNVLVTGTVNYGADTSGGDVKWFADTTGNYMQWDMDGSTNGALIFEDSIVHIMDDTSLTFGDGSDVTIQYDEDGNDDLQITGAVRFDSAVNFSADAAGVDVYLYADTTGDYVMFDADSNTNGALIFEDSIIQIMDDTSLTFGDDSDATIQYDENGNNDLQFTGAVRFDSGVTFDSAVNFSADAGGVDVYWYADTTLNYMMFDADGNTNGSLIFEDSIIHMMDDTVISLGDGGDVTMQYDEDGDDDLQITGNVSFDDTVVIGAAVTDGLTVTAAIQGASPLILDGATDNTNETTIAVADPSGDNTMTIADDTGWFNYGANVAGTGVVDYAAGAGALPVTHAAITYESTGGAEALTLGDGKPGQILTIVHDTDGGNGVLTPDNRVGYASVDLADDGDIVTLMFTGAAWAIIGTAGNAAPPVVTP